MTEAPTFLCCYAQVPLGCFLILNILIPFRIMSWGNSWHLLKYIMVTVEKPQDDAMENWKQVHRLRESSLTLATLARRDGQQCRVHPPLLPVFVFHFPVGLSPASGQTLASLLMLPGEPGPVKPPSINHSAPAMRGWVQRRQVGVGEGAVWPPVNPP